MRRSSNHLCFLQVVEESGWGWEHFGVRTAGGAVGQLYATKTLDYEAETHRRGFKFMVQVTDKVSSISTHKSMHKRKREDGTPQGVT